MKGALLLDLDGVLFDSEPLHQLAWEEALHGLGVALPPGWYAGLCGRSLLSVATAIVTGYAKGSSPQEIAERKRSAYQALARGLRPSPGVLEALLELRPRAALVTSSSRDDLQVLLVGSGLAPFLETVVTGNDVQAQKPDPAGYLLALERLALPADQCLAIEDSPSGVRAAFSAGLRVVAVSESGSPPQGAFTSRGTAALAIRFAVSALSS